MSLFANLFRRGQEQIAECVVNHPKFNPKYQYRDGSSILQLACRWVQQLICMYIIVCLYFYVYLIGRAGSLLSRIWLKKRMLTQIMRMNEGRLSLLKHAGEIFKCSNSSLWGVVVKGEVIYINIWRWYIIVLVDSIFQTSSFSIGHIQTWP